MNTVKRRSFGVKTDKIGSNRVKWVQTENESDLSAGTLYQKRRRTAITKEEKMEALLIINSLLVAICLYFIKDFHTDFKEVAKTVQGLKEKFGELSRKVNGHIRSVKKKLNSLDQVEDEE